jgi:hypothetical protein
MKELSFVLVVGAVPLPAVTVAMLPGEATERSAH